MIFYRATKTAALALALLATAPIAASAQDASISPREARSLSAVGKVLLIDVRTPEEWRDTGVAPGAKRINWRTPGGPAAFLEQVLATVDGDVSRPVALICRTGARSAQAQAFLREHGFTNVINVSEGMQGGTVGPGWIKGGLPVDPCPTC